MESVSRTQVNSISFFQRLVRIKSVKFILFFLIISYVISTVTYLFPQTADEQTEFVLDTIFEKIFFGIFLVPLLETLLFQALIISIVCKVIKRNKFNFYPAIFISAIAFAVNHSYNYYYMIYTFLAGIILALAYYLARYRKESAVLLVFIIHAAYNLSGYILDIFYSK